MYTNNTNYDIDLLKSVIYYLIFLFTKDTDYGNKYVIL